MTADAFFRMTVQDVFSIRGRGTVVTGQIESGTFFCDAEPTAAADALAHPIKALMTSLRGVRTQGEMAPEIDLTAQRPAEYIFEKMVEKLAEAPSETGSKTQRSDAA